MRFFTCLFDPEFREISNGLRSVYEAMPRDRGLAFQWQSTNPAILTGWDDPQGDPLLVQQGDWTAAGVARLDNQADLERLTGRPRATVTDLGMLLHLAAHYGTRYISQVLGDFAFVAWNAKARTVLVANDAFAVKRLFYAERNGVFMCASRAEALALGDLYEPEYLIQLIALFGPPAHLSVYRGVQALPAGSIGVLERGTLKVRQYWSAAAFEMDPAWQRSEQEANETCRQLLGESIRHRVGRNGETWAQLSGGLDSSSVVSMTQWLAEKGEIAQGLAGTVTYVDRQGTAADEREYSGSVVKRWRLRNETIIDSPLWYDERYPPPRTDQPDLDFQAYPRERRLCAVVREAGGRVLLTGWGGDELFMSSMLFFSDWLVTGRFWRALREMARRAAIGRVSFWELAWRNAIVPLLPGAAQRWLVPDPAPVQPWVEQAALDRYGLSMRRRMASAYGGPLGHKYRHAVAIQMSTLAALANRGVIPDSLDMRYPLLYRPLVEFALRLPPDLRARPQAQRWVLREALRGILPDKVRTRVGKPETGDVFALSLATARGRLAPLLRKPILGELGVVNPVKLRAAFDTPPDRTPGEEYVHAPMLSTLAVEAWLQMRSGTWPCGDVSQ